MLSLRCGANAALPMAALVVGMCLPSARADPKVAVFSGPAADCPPPQYLSDRIGNLLRESAPPNQVAQVRIARTKNGQYQAIALIQTPRGATTRRLSGESCRVALDAIAVVVAISVVPELAGEILSRADAAPANQAHGGRASPAATDSALSHKPSRSPSEKASAPPGTPSEKASAPPGTPGEKASAPPGTPSEKASAPPGEEVPPSPGEMAADPARYSVAVLALVDGLAMPTVAFGAAGAIMARIGPHLGLELSGSAFGTQEIRRDDGKGANFGLLSAEARACHFWQAERLILGPCVAVIGLRLVGSGIGTVNTYTGEDFSWGPAVGVMARIRVARPVGVRAYAEAYLPANRPRFLLEGQEVHRLPLMSVSVGIGPELSF